MKCDTGGLMPISKINKREWKIIPKKKEFNKITDEHCRVRFEKYKPPNSPIDKQYPVPEFDYIDIYGAEIEIIED